MPVTVHTFVTSEPDSVAAIADLREQVTAADAAPDFIFAFYSCGYDDTLLHSFLQHWAPGVPVIGGSSGRGVMSNAGLGADSSIGLMTISDDTGSFGVAAAPLGPDPAATAETMIHAALASADATGELPELVWIYLVPGREEAVLEGLRRVVGDRCPIVGGSSASEVFGTPDLEGQPTSAPSGWRQLGPDGPMSDGLAVAVLFPSGGVRVSYQSGFEPIGDSGVITSLGHDGLGTGTSPNSGRHVRTIDDEPAAEVYDRWLGGELPADIAAHGGDISVRSALNPWGAVAGTVNGLTYFRLIHVDAVTDGGGLRTFAEVTKGSRIYAMRGSRPSLIHRAGRVAASAVSMLEGDGGQVAGALMVCCVGCRLAVGDEIAEIADSARVGFHGTPFLGCFTSGEQGPVVVESVHTNLMISAVVFGR
ncbi:MAG: FIST N-terminal domain-containing protein [Nakamurella sp.]